MHGGNLRPLTCVRVAALRPGGQLAALRSSDTAMCAALLASGADVSRLATLPAAHVSRSAEVAPMLRVLAGEDAAGVVALAAY